MAKQIVLDAKVDYPAACNAMVICFIYLLIIFVIKLLLNITASLDWQESCFLLIILGVFSLSVALFTLVRRHFLYIRIWFLLASMSLLTIFAPKVRLSLAKEIVTPHLALLGVSSLSKICKVLNRLISLLHYHFIVYQNSLVNCLPSDFLHVNLCCTSINRFFFFNGTFKKNFFQIARIFVKGN